MLENFVTDALKRLPDSPATMIHRIYQKVDDKFNADKSGMPDCVRDWIAMSAIDMVCNMKLVKTKLGKLNTGAYLVVALLNELDAVKDELAKLKAANGGN